MEEEEEKEAREERAEKQTCKSVHLVLDETEEAPANRALEPSHVVCRGVQLVDGWVFVWFRVK